MEQLGLTEEEMWGVLRSRYARAYRNNKMAMQEVAEAQTRKVATILQALVQEWANQDETAHWIAASLQGILFESEYGLERWQVTEER